MKKNITTVLEEFENWLIDNEIVGEGSARSYADSYVPGLIEKVLTPYFEKAFEGLDPYATFRQSSVFSTDGRLILAASEEIILKEREDKSSALSAKTLSNYRSGLRAFIGFLSAEGLCFDVKPTASQRKSMTAFVTEGNSAVTYTCRELFGIFKSRLITQDRAFNRMLYCARMIHRIFNQSALKKDYDALFDRVISNVRFLLEDGNSVCLKDIKKVLIYPNRYTLVCLNDGTRHKLYTLTTEKQRVLLRALTVADLSLDHDTTLENILNNDAARSDYPHLKTVGDCYAGSCTDLYLDYCPGVRKFSTRTKERFSACQDTLTDADFVRKLYADMKKFYDVVSLTVMLRRDNSKKGKGSK